MTNGTMKREMSLWKVLADEMASRCSTSATLDFKTVECRVKHEGLSFLTITLPSFGKDLQRALDVGKVDRSLFQGFSWRAGLPEFLQGFLDRVFDRCGGTLLDSPCIDSIQAMRQLTLMFSKVEIPCSDAREFQAMRGFVECEQDVRKSDAELSPQLLEDFKRVSDLLFRPMLSNIEIKIYNGDIVPKHGPGATADRLRANAKYRQREWTDRLEEVFPAGENLLPNWRFYDQYDRIVHLEPGAERPVRVISVPKTQKTPRIIAIEPTCMQYMQQGLLEQFVHEVERYKYLKDFIGFLDQTPNQRLAKEGSLTGSLATLDLSEASDRVSNQLVRTMLSDFPLLNAGVDATRSRSADVPGHGVIRLAKFASMGSALCFPIEAMVFLTSVFVGIEQELNVPLTLKRIKRFRGKVRIFGDDIIVPENYVHSAVRSLEAFGARVGTDKSFWTGKFRESCGKEYYDGHDVSIVKVRDRLPAQRTDATGVISLVSLRNQHYWAGNWKTASYLDDEIRDLIKHFPVVLPTSPVLGRESVLGFETQRVHEHLHTPLVKGYVVSSRPPINRLDDSGALLKFMLKRGGLPSVDSMHLERSGRPQAVNIKLRWARSD